MNIASYLSHYIRENYVSLILEYLIAKTFELVKETLGNLDSSTTEELNFNPKPKQSLNVCLSVWKLVCQENRKTKNNLGLGVTSLN